MASVHGPSSDGSDLGVPGLAKQMGSHQDLLKGPRVEGLIC